MSVPPKKAAHLVVVQPQIFGVFKRFLDMPSGSKSLHHLAERGSLWGKDEVIALLLRVGDAPTNEQEVASIILPAMQIRHTGPVKEPGTFGPLTQRETVPLLLMQHEGFHVTHFHPSALSVRRQDPNGFIACD